MAKWSADCTVEELLAQRDRLRVDLDELEMFIYEKRITDKFGVTLGKTLVEHNGETYVIADLEAHLRLQEFNNKVVLWIAGWKLRTDGTPSKNVQYLCLGHEKINIIGEYND